MLNSLRPFRQPVIAMHPHNREQDREEYRNFASGSGGNSTIPIDTWLERFNKTIPVPFISLSDAPAMVEATSSAKEEGGKKLAWIHTLSWANFQGVILPQFFPRSEQERLKSASIILFRQGQREQRGASTAPRQELSLVVLHKSNPRPLRSDKRHKSGDQHQSSNQQNSHRGHDQRNDRHGSDRQGGSGTLVLDATIGTGVSSPTELPILVPSKTRHRPRVILTLSAPHVDVDTQESVVMRQDGYQRSMHDRLSFPVRVKFGNIHTPEFIIMEFPTGKSMKSFLLWKALTLLSPREGAEPISKALIACSRLSFKSLKDQFARVVGAGFIRNKYRHWGAPVFCSSRKMRSMRLCIDYQGINHGSGEVDAITKVPRPTSVTEVRSFLGLAGYYRRFVDGFSRLALPLTKLMRKGEKFVWDDEREKSFEELKQRLVSAPILTLPSGSGGFQIYSDASKKGLAHFLPIRKDFSISRLAEMFQQEIVRLHGTPSAIISDRDPRFTSRFWKEVLQTLGEPGSSSGTAYHPRQTDIRTYDSDTGGHEMQCSYTVVIKFVRRDPLRPRDDCVGTNEEGRCRQIREDLSYTEEPESILDRQVRVMRKKTNPCRLKLWMNHPERKPLGKPRSLVRPPILISLP
ncbi:putative reverse transcriptase domain, aspartic peptidase domain protein [Tanacetum coccineum]